MTERAQLLALGCPALPDRRRPLAVLAGTLAAALLLGGCGSDLRGHLQAPENAVGTVLAQRSCPDSEFECITLAVPADHLAERSPLWAATFPLHRGDVDSRGVLVTATGGLGASGIASADFYMSTMSPEITDHYDLVFFDQRGIGLTRPFRCDEAMASSGPEAIDSSADGAARDAYAAASQAFLDACFDEAGAPASDARRYSTRQSAEDLEVFRTWLGADALILYGESYGTQYQSDDSAADGAAPRPAIGADPPYPVLLLTADTDPNTPMANADRLLAAVAGGATSADVALVRRTGGPHVIYGRGEPCVDDLVTEVVTSGRLPATQVTVCPGEVSDPCQAVAPAEAGGYDDLYTTVDVLLGAILTDAMVDTWDGDQPLTLGSSAGGTARYSLDWLSTMQVDLHDCAWTPGVPVNGSVTADDGGFGDVELAVELPFASLDLTKDGELTGTFRGEPVD